MGRGLCPALRPHLRRLPHPEAHHQGLRPLVRPARLLRQFDLIPCWSGLSLRRLRMGRDQARVLYHTHEVNIIDIYIYNVLVYFWVSFEWSGKVLKRLGITGLMSGMANRGGW